ADRRLVWLDSPSGRPRSVPMTSGQISVVCRAPGDQSHPVVGGNDQVGYYVAWMDNRTGKPDVYVYSLSQELEIPLGASSFESMYPEISGNIIAWIARNPLNEYHIWDYWSIRTFDMSIDNRSELVWGLVAPAPIGLSDQYLTYLDKPVESFGWMVYKKLLYGKETNPSIPPSGENTRAAGNVIVYQSSKNGNWNIWLWRQNQDPVQLTSGPGDKINPATDGHTVVWQDNRNGNWDIYSYDLNTTREMQVTTDNADHTNPDVSNGVIVWQDKRRGDWDIHGYDMNVNKEIQICVAPGNQTEPRISGGRIVWTDDRSGNKDIYIMENYAP
ncbi:MAG TPA: hypothetical protein VLY86_02555, partial [Methanothrix sp.]|nr:hypothetical protein [Methanothrix sp.]